jgi:hypothetical protein
MSLSHFSIKRPIAVSALIVALIFLGVNSWRKMGLELMPKTDIPYVTVVTTYAGASPSEIETDIAKKIEDAVSTLDGLKHVQSVAMENVCQTIMEFDLAVDVDVAAADVRDKVDQILNDLPEEAGRPQVIKIDINAMPIITVALTGTNPVGDLYDYADNSLRDRFSVIRGVANVELIGGSKTEVQVLLDPRRGRRHPEGGQTHPLRADPGQGDRGVREIRRRFSERLGHGNPGGGEHPSGSGLSQGRGDGHHGARGGAPGGLSERTFGDQHQDCEEGGCQRS